jgi:transmembrane sensor
MKDMNLSFNSKNVPADPLEAAEWWMARKSLGLLSARELAAFDRWLEAPVNASAFATIEQIDQDLGAFAAEPEILQLRAQALKHRPNFEARYSRWAAVFAAIMVLGGASFGLMHAKPNFTVAASDTDSTIPTSERYETKVGERRQVRLSDGSIVTLNTGSLVEVAYTAQRRDVRLLHGEAMFKVAHNSAWPFVVSAGDRSVTAVGTAFVVRVDGPAIKVVLVQGKVRVNPLQPSGLARMLPVLAEDELTPGEQLTAQEGTRRVTVASTDVERAMSWESGEIIFRDDTIDTAVSELNRYSKTRILINDPRIAALKVSGVFNAERPENFVAAVTAFYPIVAVHRSADVTELTWRAES